MLPNDVNIIFFLIRIYEVRSIVQQSRNIYRPVDGWSDGTRYSISPFVSKFSNAPTTIVELHTYLVAAASAAS